VYLTIKFLHLSLVYLFKPAVWCLVPPEYLCLFTKLHGFIFRKVDTAALTAVRISKLRIAGCSFRRTTGLCIRLHGRPGQNRKARPEAVSFVMTSQPQSYLLQTTADRACRPLQQTISIFLVPGSVCVHLVGLLGPEIRPLQGITYRHSHAVGL
jgi:hypothetical protein